MRRHGTGSLAQWILRRMRATMWRVGWRLFVSMRELCGPVEVAAERFAATYSFDTVGCVRKVTVETPFQARPAFGCAWSHLRGKESQRRVVRFPGTLWFTSVSPASDSPSRSSQHLFAIGATKDTEGCYIRGEIWTRGRCRRQGVHEEDESVFGEGQCRATPLFPPAIEHAPCPS